MMARGRVRDVARLGPNPRGITKRMRKTTLLVFAALLFVSCGTIRDGSGFWQSLEGNYESTVYAQDRVMLVDAPGDAFLIRQLDTIPIKVMSYLIHKTLPQLQTPEEKDAFETGRSLPIDNGRLLDKCAEIMRRHAPGIMPSLGEEHAWSPEARRYIHYGYWHRLWRRLSGRQKDFPTIMLRGSKLFFCLACGWTSRYCITGQEEALTARILSRPDRSLQLHELFEESYVLNKGDIYFTFLTCENVLASHPHRKERVDDPVQQKLSYIRHDSDELGDNYGAWYHFFGIALYGMLRTGIKSVFVANTESLGSFFMEGPDRQEALINHHGALFGRRFRKMILDGSWQAEPEPGFRTDYLLPNPLSQSL